MMEDLEAILMLVVCLFALVMFNIYLGALLP
jgi:hypothetical protein